MRSLACLIVLITQLAWADEKAVAAIEALYADWRVAVETGDIDGYVAGLDENVRLLPPSAPAIVGAQNYAQFLVPVFDTATYKIEVVEAPTINVQGDVAVSEYVYTIELTLKNPDQAITEPGALTESRTTARYFDVLRKTDAGWRVWRHAWQAF